MESAACSTGMADMVAVDQAAQAATVARAATADFVAAEVGAMARALDRMAMEADRMATDRMAMATVRMATGVAFQVAVNLVAEAVAAQGGTCR